MPIPKLHFMTISNRPQHIRRRASSIEESGVIKYFDFVWVLRFDLEVDNVSDDLISFLDNLPFNIDFKFTKDKRNCVGGNYSRGIVAKETPTDVWLWQFDDDNSVHPDYAREISSCIQKNPKENVIITWQKDRFRPMKVSDIRVGIIDAANYTWKSDIGRKADFPTIYGADGIFLENILKLNRNKATFIHKDLCYYNTHAHMNHLKTEEVLLSEEKDINVRRLMTKNKLSTIKPPSAIVKSRKKHLDPNGFISFSISLVNKMYGSKKIVLTIGPSNEVTVKDMPNMLYRKVSPSKLFLFNKSTNKKIGEILNNKHTGEYLVSLDVDGKTSATSWIGRKSK